MVSIVLSFKIFTVNSQDSDDNKSVPTAHAQGVLGKKAALPCDIQPLAAEDHVSMVL
ncbi:hypothetical protein SFRURICE_003328, partial [Spodoptera frugiperda]